MTRTSSGETVWLRAIMDSLTDPVLVADANHIIRYMNQAAAKKYEGSWDLLGRSLLDCHNAQSQATMREVLAALEAGETERCITDNAQHRVYMRAVRDPAGQLLGYYERYAPPAQEQQ